jgi:hypothetical protein
MLGAVSTDTTEEDATVTLLARDRPLDGMPYRRRAAMARLQSFDHRQSFSRATELGAAVAMV